MKILFFIHHLEKGGAERVLQGLSGYFAEKNYECDIVYFGQNLNYYKFNQNVQVRPLLRSQKQGENRGKFITKFAHIMAIRAEIKRQNPDLIISFMDFTNFDLIIANFALKSKLIVTEHVNHTMLNSPRWVKIRKFLYQFADGLTVLTKDDYDYYSFVKNREIIYNPAVFEPPKQMQKEKIILSVGRLEDVKGYKEYFKALALIDKKIILEWRIIIAGDGALKQDLQNLACNLGIEVEFLGHLKEIATLYEKGQILVLTSKNEGLPNVLIETIFYKIARLATKTAGAKELITDGRNGLLCEIDDEDSIAQKLMLLMTDDGLRERLVQNALSQQDDFSIKTIGAQWDKFIQKVTKNEKA